MNKDIAGRPVIFGEVLYDIFPDGQMILGGAPFNVAWHLQGFGLSPLMVSAVGNDRIGRRASKKMREWGMDTAMLQVCEEASTGRVAVTLDQGQPRYDILAGQAYDRIDSSALEVLREKRDLGLLYHGSLIERGEQSRSFLRALRRQSNLPVFMDVNLRPPWWRAEQVHAALTGARWVKLNDEELGQLTGQAIDDFAAIIAAARGLRERHSIELLIVTRGERGAICVTERDSFASAAAPVKQLLDTVGAGDAFSAVAIYGLLRNWPLDVLLQRSLRFASVICGIRGATTPDRTVYKRQMESWDEQAG